MAWAGAAPAEHRAHYAEGLLRIENCRIVDDRGPVKAMGDRESLRAIRPKKACPTPMIVINQ